MTPRFFFHRQQLSRMFRVFFFTCFFLFSCHANRKTISFFLFSIFFRTRTLLSTLVCNVRAFFFLLSFFSSRVSRRLFSLMTRHVPWLIDKMKILSKRTLTHRETIELLGKTDLSFCFLSSRRRRRRLKQVRTQLR